MIESGAGPGRGRAEHRADSAGATFKATGECSDSCRAKGLPIPAVQQGAGRIAKPRIKREPASIPNSRSEFSFF